MWSCSNADPGIWLDHVSWKLGNQSAKFFKALKEAGGELDEIVLDTEIGTFLTWGAADNFDHTNPGAAAWSTSSPSSFSNGSVSP